MTRMLRPRLSAIALALAAAGTAACQEHEFHPPDRAQQVGAADTLLDDALFDSISWSSDSARAFVGNDAWAAYCRSCHGYLGQGDTDYGREHNVTVPSLVRPDWPYNDVAAARRRIFTGHPSGMPTWGVGGIEPREIDAVAYYLLAVLRPEVLSTTSR